MVESESLFIKCEKILENLKENFRKMWKYIENARKLLVKVTDVHYNKISVFNLGGKSKWPAKKLLLLSKKSNP